MNGYVALARCVTTANSPLTRARTAAAAPPLAGLRRAAPAFAGGLLGAAVGGAHPVLGALLGSAIVKNAVDYASGDADGDQAIRRVGSHAIATAGSLVLPGAPLVGYCIGAVAGGFVIGVDAPSLDAVRAGKATLRRGMTGDSVTYIQGVVGVVADGKFGPKTEKAIEAFQQRYSVPVNGVVDAETLAKIDRLAGGPGAVAKVNFTPQDGPRNLPLPPPTSLDQSQPSPPAASSAVAPAPSASMRSGDSRPASRSFFDALDLDAPLYKDAPVTRKQTAVIAAVVAAVGGAAYYFSSRPSPESAMV